MLNDVVTLFINPHLCIRLHHTVHRTPIPKQHRITQTVSGLNKVGESRKDTFRRQRLCSVIIYRSGLAIPLIASVGCDTTPDGVKRQTLVQIDSYIGCMKIGYEVNHGRHFVLVVGNLKPSVVSHPKLTDAIEIVGLPAPLQWVRIYRLSATDAWGRASRY